MERECYCLFKVRQSKNIETRADIDKLSASSADIDLKIDLTNAIISLPLIYRQVLILRDIQEYSTPEVAEKLGITVEAVKSRLHRARLMVKEKINL
ncbi:sigma factor-like helix-turn-helix DNA-binding protein [Snodgrassella alvi]|uniref:sigma factor-like helix-turn-helix DNA-binding protein n=1 Tax=Snodgrassella sp. W6238H14 TaxID=2751014 RepID=UPI0031196BEA